MDRAGNPMRWRRKDLAQWMFEEFRISMHETTVGRELKALGFVSCRPVRATRFRTNWKRTLLVLPCDTNAMQQHFAEISVAVGESSHAVLFSTRWDGTSRRN